VQRGSSSARAFFIYNFFYDIFFDNVAAPPSPLLGGWDPRYADATAALIDLVFRRNGIDQSRNGTKDWAL